MSFLFFSFLLLTINCFCTDTILEQAGQEVVVDDTFSEVHTDQSKYVCCVSTPTNITGPTIITGPGQYAVVSNLQRC